MLLPTCLHLDDGISEVGLLEVAVSSPQSMYDEGTGRQTVWSSSVRTVGLRYRDQENTLIYLNSYLRPTTPYTFFSNLELHWKLGWVWFENIC